MAGAEGDGPEPEGGRRNVWGTLLAILLLLGLAGGAIYFLTQRLGSPTPTGTSPSAQATR